MLVCVREHSGARGMARLVLLELAGFAHDDGSGVWAAQRTIADRAGIDRATVQRALAVLAESGRVDVNVRGGPRGTNLYRVRLCPSCRTERQEGARTPHAAQSGKGGRRERQGVAAQSGMNTVLEHRQESARDAGSTPNGAVAARCKHRNDPAECGACKTSAGTGPSPATKAELWAALKGGPQ